MAYYPGATRHLLPRNSVQPRIKPISVVLHTAVSRSNDLYDFFNGRSSGVESHFYVLTSGKVIQYMDTERRADCQLGGNNYAVSIESQDNGASRPGDIISWAPEQLAAIVALVTWLCRTHDIPAVKCPAYNKPGLGYHQLFTKPKPHQDCWNNSHACPSPRRIAQFPDVVAGVQAALRGVNVVATNSKYAPFPGESWFHGSPRSDVVTEMGKRLVAVGCGKYTEGPGPQWSDADKASYAAWQQKLGYSGADADGWPGEGSWDKLQVPNPDYKAPVPPKPTRKPDATPKELLMPGTPARLVKAPDSAAVYVVDLLGRAWHIEDAAHLAAGRSADYYANNGKPDEIPAAELERIRATA